MQKTQQFFRGLRQVLWPIYRSEFKKVALFFSLLCFICISYSILRNLKDAVVLTGNASGAEIIPFLKVWGILPAVFGATWLYTRLARVFSKEMVFYLILGSFVSFFLFFSFVLYPNLPTLCLERSYFASAPHGLRGLVDMVCNWPLSLFYIVAELWSVLLLTVVFWGFTNDIFGVKEAKRTYGILNMGSNVAPIIAGSLAIFLTQRFSLPEGIAINAFHGNLIALTGVVVLCSCVSFSLFWIINRKIVKIPFEWRAIGVEEKRVKGKAKLSMRASFKAISESRYLILLACIVVCYSIAINLTDVLWKQQLKSYFSDPSLMLAHMSLVSFGTGIFAVLGALFFSALVHRFGWTFTAILTPLLMSVLAIGFFTCYFFGQTLSGLTFALFGLSPLALTAYFGSWQNLLSKAGKYSIFDATKELAFLPLPAHERIKGKAAIDGLGSGIGKSGSSLFYQGLLLVCGSVGASSPIIALILLLTLFAWLLSVTLLGKQFKVLAQEEPAIAPSLEPTLSQ